MFNKENQPKTESSPDTNELITLIIRLATARRMLNTYPSGHPLIDDAFQKVINSYQVFTKNNPEINLGIAKDVILINNIPLETSQQVVRGFAKALFEKGIAVLTIGQGLTPEELRSFITILGLKREQINQDGGIDLVWEKAKIFSLSIKSINYNLLGMKNYSPPTDIPSTGIWELITRALLTDNTTINTDNMTEQLDPEILAEMLNINLSNNDSIPYNEQQTSINSFNHQSIMVNAAHNNSISIEKMAAFVAKLNPSLRQQFLESSQGLIDNKGKPLTEGILSSMPAEVLMETFEEFNNNQQQISPIIMSLIGKLAGHPPQNDMATELCEDELHTKMRIILREHPSEEFVPEDYQQKLNLIINENQLPQIQTAELESSPGSTWSTNFSQ